MRGFRESARRLASLATLLTVVFGAACGAATNPGIPVGDAARALSFARAPSTTGAGKIDHVIIIVQENRSFDNLFAGLRGADTQPYGYDSQGKKIALAPITLATSWDLEHSFAGFFEDCDGRGTFPGTKCRMDGFDNEQVGCGLGSEPKCPNAHPQFAYVPRSEVRPYFDMASQYVVGDRMFESMIDGSSFVSHQYLIAAQANSAVDVPFGGPWGCGGGPGDLVNTVTTERQLGPPVSPCFDNATLGDELDSAGISWKYYTHDAHGHAALWNGYQAIKHIRYGKDWKKDIISPQKRFFDDVSSGNLATVSWVTPTCRNSDHAGCRSKTGPHWVASLVNAIGESRYWKTSAIFIFWDDYGGWYDHVPPHYVDYDGLGFRVPLVVVSPYAKRGYVSHVRYEHGSLLRFIEDRFALGQLSASDARAISPASDCFDFSQSPRKFRRISTPMTQRDFEAQPPDGRPADTD
ncbi:MAG TPA: alkaline phosphatase family protein [Candidatus Cybelea sp.]|nr:alkaline phosphatase family protein [Candidatus Cybelea sp.]